MQLSVSAPPGRAGPAAAVTVGDHVIRVMKLLHAGRHRAPRPHPQVDPLDYPYLFRVHAAPCRVSDLATAFHAEISTVSRTVSQLVDLGLVTAEAGGEPAHPHLRIAHPLFADVLRDDPDREEVARVAAACLLSSGLAEHRLSGILLLRRTSTPPAASDLAWAAGRLYATGDVEAAVVIAREAELGDLTPAERFSTALHLANAHSALGALDDADAHYARADLLARRPEDAVLLAGRRGEHLAFRRFDVEAAVAQADEIGRAHV